MGRVKTRFAPSPTGYLHIGHAFAAREAFGWADRQGGACLLRLEDIDQTRCRSEYEAAIYKDLSWLGLSWPQPVRRQSDHFADFELVLSRLRELGVVYRSFLSRKQIQIEMDRAEIEVSPAGERPYQGPGAPISEDEEEALLASGHAYAWRLSLAACRDLLGDDYMRLGFEECGSDQALPKGWIHARPDWLGDVILARKDTPTSYHIAVTHDDALQEISHVVRGADLFHATHIHVVLQKLMGWDVPVYLHHGLLLDPDGRKFSKTDRAKTLHSLRAEGIRPERLLQDWR